MTSSRIHIAAVILTAAVAASTAAAIRVVPQTSIPEQGVKSPDGVFMANAAGSSLRVFNLQTNTLAWNFPALQCRTIVFSPDSTHLATSSPKGGLILNLTTGRTICSGALTTTALTFTADSQHLLTAAPGRLSGRYERRVNTDTYNSPAEMFNAFDEMYFLQPRPTLPAHGRLFQLSLAGELIKTFALEMSGPQLLEPLPSEGPDTIRIAGRDGNVPLAHTRDGKTGVLARQTLNLKTGATTILKGNDVGLLHAIELPGRAAYSPTAHSPASPRWDCRLACSDRDGLAALTTTPFAKSIWIFDLPNKVFRRIDKDFALTVGGFITPDRLAVCSSHVLSDERSHKVLGVLHIPAGQTYPLPFMDAEDLRPTNNGKHIWLLRDTRLYLFDIEKRRSVADFDAGYHKTLDDLRSPVAVDDLRRRVIRTENGDIIAQPFDKGPAIRFKNAPGNNRQIFALSNDCRFLAIASGAADKATLAVMDTETNAALRVRTGFDRLFNTIWFADADNIIACTGLGQLTRWNWREDRIVWQSQLHLSTYHTHAHFFNNTCLIYDRGQEPFAAAIDIETGRVKWKHHGCRAHRLPRCNLLLEIRPNSPIIDLIDLDTGRQLLTFCFPENADMILWDAEGHWSGPPSALRHIRLYRDAALLPAAETLTFCDKPAIDEILDNIFARKATTQ